MVGRVFKAKYYPNCNFLEAELGHSPSYVWRSVLESQYLLKKGARWRVGDGSCINVLGQPWLQTAQDPYIRTNHPALEGIFVNTLMCTGTREWDDDILEDLFEARDRDLIHKISL